MRALLLNTLMLSSVSLFFQTSPGRGGGGWGAGGTSPERALGISMGDLQLQFVIGP